MDLEKVPSTPPFNAFVGNLAYDATEDDLRAFFNDLKVVQAKIMKEKFTNRSRGFGYVEFGDRQSLIKALERSEHEFLTRRIKVDIAEPPRDREDGRQSRGGPSAFRRPEADAGNWRERSQLDDEPPSLSRAPANFGKPRFEGRSDGDDRRDEYARPRFQRESRPPKFESDTKDWRARDAPAAVSQDIQN
jgi:translation initiation factor 4B